VFWLQTLSTLDRCRNNFSKLLNVHGLNDIRQAEIYAPEPLVLESIAYEIEMALEKQKDSNLYVLIKSQQN
jgi:hypothetical protein